MEMEKKLLLCAQRLADWYCRNTADDGSTPFMIYTEDRRIEPAYEWSTAFAFMGMISAFSGMVFSHVTEGIKGFLPVCVLGISAIVMAICGLLVKKAKITWLENYAMPFSMLISMAFAVLIAPLFGV